MIIDSNAIFLDSKNVTSSAVTGDPVALTHLFKPGRAEPVRVCVKVLEAFAGGTSIEFTLKESDSKDGTYTAVDGGSVEVVTASLAKGKTIGWRFLPSGVKKQWLKMTATPTGTFTAGSVFAAVVREEEQAYEEGMFIDAGFVKG